MKKILFILTFIFANSVSAGSFASFYSNCVQNRNGQFDYTIDQLGPASRELYTPSGLLDSASFKIFTHVIRGSTRLYDEARNVLSVVENKGFTKGSSIRVMTINTIRQQVQMHRMNDFEKASLVNCAVSNLIKYKSNRSTKLGSVLEIYEKGEGICTEMTVVANDLANAIGLEARSVTSNQDHNWPEYKIDGRWFILDPTVGSFHFYEALKE